MKAEDINDFEDILEQAESNANTDWEINFCSDMRDRYDQYGYSMFVSDKQIDALKRIANW